mgnify:CR=1 FL=1
MSEEFQKTLFDPFTREEKSGTNKVQGTGLGMAITKSIVDLMGGSISVESAPGRVPALRSCWNFPLIRSRIMRRRCRLCRRKQKKLLPCPA